MRLFEVHVTGQTADLQEVETLAITPIQYILERLGEKGDRLYAEDPEISLLVGGVRDLVGDIGKFLQTYIETSSKMH